MVAVEIAKVLQIQSYRAYGDVHKNRFYIVIGHKRINADEW
jgi:hypothetical protein